MNKKVNREKKPLERHRKILENLGKGKTLGASIKEAGYSQNYADNPQQLRQTKSWDVLMKSFIDDEFLVNKHLELLEAKEIKHFSFPKKMKDKEIKECLEDARLKVVVIQESAKGKIAFYSVDNNRAIIDGLDMAYKLKGLYSPDKHHINKFAGYSDQQLREMLLEKLTGKKWVK